MFINGGNLQQAEFNAQDSCEIDLATVFLVLATTGYRVYRLVLDTQPCTLASTTTGYRVCRLVLATQPCTLQQLITEWYWLHSLVHLLQPTGYKVY